MGNELIKELIQDQEKEIGMHFDSVLKCRWAEKALDEGMKGINVFWGLKESLGMGS